MYSELHPGLRRSQLPHLCPEVERQLLRAGSFYLPASGNEGIGDPDPNVTFDSTWTPQKSSRLPVWTLVFFIPDGPAGVFEDHEENLKA